MITIGTRYKGSYQEKIYVRRMKYVPKVNNPQSRIIIVIWIFLELMSLIKSLDNLRINTPINRKIRKIG